MHWVKEAKGKAMKVEVFDFKNWGILG